MTNSLHEQIRTSCVAFKEVLKQEIEYFKASGKFEDLENHQKKLKEIMDFVQHFIDNDVLGLFDSSTFVNLFRIAVTCIIRDNKTGKYLIVQRSKKEGHGGGMWTVPGGIIENEDWKNIPSKFDFPLWYDVATRALKREVKEEVNLTVEHFKYLTDCIFIHKTSNLPEIVLSFYAIVFSGDVKLSSELSDFKWVTVKEAEQYNLLVDILAELRMTEHLVKFY